MLQVTTRAVRVLREERLQRGLPDNFGLRVRLDRTDSNGGIRLEFTERPAAGDEVGETAGLPVFVEPDLAEALADHAIDTQSTPKGADLVLREQSELEE